MYEELAIEFDFTSDWVEKLRIMQNQFAQEKKKASVDTSFQEHASARARFISEPDDNERTNQNRGFPTATTYLTQ